MKQYWIVLIVFGCFVFEGTLFEWVIPSSWQLQVYVVPHIILIAVLYIAMFRSRYLGLMYGLVFGLLQDVIYYGHALGVYSFTLGLIGYAAGLLFRRVTFGIVTSLIFVLFGLLLYETLVFAIYRLFLNVIRVDIEWAFIHQMLPSTLFNLLLALAIYVPARKWLEPRDTTRDGEEQ
jgi:rod shape-determining protein MreD